MSRHFLHKNFFRESLTRKLYTNKIDVEKPLMPHCFYDLFTVVKLVRLLLYETLLKCARIGVSMETIRVYTLKPDCPIKLYL